MSNQPETLPGYIPRRLSTNEPVPAYPLRDHVMTGTSVYSDTPSAAVSAITPLEPPPSRAAARPAPAIANEQLQPRDEALNLLVAACHLLNSPRQQLNVTDRALLQGAVTFFEELAKHARDVLSQAAMPSDLTSKESSPHASAEYKSQAKKKKPGETREN